MNTVKCNLMSVETLWSFQTLKLVFLFTFLIACCRCFDRDWKGKELLPFPTECISISEYFISKVPSSH